MTIAREYPRFPLLLSTLLLTGMTAVAGAAPPPATLNVDVVNTPLPVQGTVNVGNLPATQAVSGSVSITGTANVKVVNAPANPLATLDASRNPLNIVEIIAQASDGTGLGTFFVQGPDGNVTAFTSLPNDRALVITSADFLPVHVHVPLVNIQFGPAQLGGIPSPRPWVVSGMQSTSLAWPTGFVIGPGQTLAIESFGDDVQVRFRGYFVPQ